MTDLLSNISLRELKRAISIRTRIENLQRKLATVLGDSPPGNTNGKPKRKSMSAAGRARIAAAQRLRWAKKGKSKVKRKMSAAGRAKIAAAARARWAKAKKAGRNSLAS
jgi:hypothetical protein